MVANTERKNTERFKKKKNDFCPFFIFLHYGPTSSRSIKCFFFLTFCLVSLKLQNRLRAAQDEKMTQVYKHYHRDQREYGQQENKLEICKFKF